jgi:hypothetical protein
MADPIVIEKDMSLSVAEFLRDLPRALPAGFRLDGRLATWSEGGRRGEIAIVAEGERRIAQLALPRVTVRIALEGYGAAAAKAFLARFDQVYQRGGG